MWQKLNRIDIFELEKARAHVLNAIQLVSAPVRCYMKSKTKLHRDWLIWNPNTCSMESRKFGTKEKVMVTLDINQFVLSIHGIKDHIEHLVLSGITYPMAFGWMKIKLDLFHLNSDLFNDDTGYLIEHPFNTDEELNVTNQNVFESLVIYYLNADLVLHQISKDLNIKGELLINPSNLNLEIDSASNKYTFGFSPGNKIYPEPFFYFRLNNFDADVNQQRSNSIGIWNTKNWHGYVLLSSEFLTLEPDQEERNVLDFFNQNYRSLLNE